MGTATVTVTAHGGKHTYTVPIPSPSAARFPGDPGVGRILWGQTRDGGVPAVPARAAQYGQILGRGPVYPSGIRRYITPTQSTVAGAKAALVDVRTVQSWGALPFLDVKEPGPMSFAQVAAGGMDDVIDTIMEGAVAANRPLMVGFHQEPAGDGKGGYADCGNALKRFAQRRDAAGGQRLVGVTCCLGVGSFAGYGGSQPDALSWIQSTAPWSDALGTHHYLEALDTSPPSAWRTVQQVMGPFWDLQDEVDSVKARVHGEWNVHTRASDLSFAPAWMDSFYAYCLARRVAGAWIFDSGENSHGHPWDLDLNGETSRLVKFAHQLAYPTSGYALKAS